MSIFIWYYMHIYILSWMTMDSWQYTHTQTHTIQIRRCQNIGILARVVHLSERITIVYTQWYVRHKPLVFHSAAFSINENKHLTRTHAAHFDEYYAGRCITVYLNATLCHFDQSWPNRECVASDNFCRINSIGEWMMMNQTRVVCVFMIMLCVVSECICLMIGHYSVFFAYIILHS